jgi:ferredoxin
MRARVDEQKCQGHTLCAMVAPDVFSLREDDGHSYVPNEHIAPEDEAAVRNAAASCPEQAIVIVD